ncbi:MAG: GNAT family N-acetyltransferase [Candidatus Hydrogenedens sp.]|nr:GNAT family N-acetyltransferase [Candidatus Hydrogenedens sp.]
MPVKMDVYLRRADRDDMETVIAWMEDEDFQRFLYGDPARSPKQLRAQIVGMLGRTTGHTMPGAVYLLIDSPSRGPVGMVSLQNISWRNRNCSVDVYIGQKELRAGLVAGLSTYRALEYAFDELNLHRVSAYIYSFNRPSWRTFELSGAQREMTFPEHVQRDGEYHDVYAYGLLREEFQAIRGRYARVDGMSLQDMIRDLAPSHDA